MNEMRKLIEAIEEANQGGKTEHSGAKKGKGAYYGRKKEAKRDSNKNRRNAGKSQAKEITEVTTEGGTAYSLGTVKVTVFEDEITLYHGFGEQIFLSREEFSDFVRGIALNKLAETLEYAGETVKCDDCESTNVSADKWIDDNGNDRTEYTCDDCDTGWEY